MNKQGGRSLHLGLPKDFQDACYRGHYIATNDLHFSQIEGQCPDEAQRQILQDGEIVEALIG